MIGDLLGRYEVLEEVGQGGMSVVYRGRDTVLKREVAIKVLHPHLQSRPESRARFEREAVAVAKLSHPNILQIYDFSHADAARSYIVTEFIQGQTLRQFIDDNPVAHPEVAAMVGVRLCDAVAHAHDLGIIHRDIKPENVMICDDGALKLMDFGIAQIVDAHAMTVTGTLLGSPAHMSPEMIEGRPMDFRADIFSMGTLLYFVATGQLPFTGPNPPLVLKAIMEGNYPEAEMINPRVGRTLSRIIDKSLALDPDDRFESMRVFQARLQTFLDDCELSDVEGWLTDAFTQPVLTQGRLRIHLLKVLERRGRETLKAGRVAAALGYFNRVLAIDPEHPEVLKLIRRIDRRRKLTVYVGAAALVAVTAGVVAAVGSMGGDDPDDVDDPTVVSPALLDAGVPAGDDAPQALADAAGQQARASALAVVQRLVIEGSKNRTLAEEDARRAAVAAAGHQQRQASELAAHIEALHGEKRNNPIPPVIAQRDLDAGTPRGTDAGRDPDAGRQGSNAPPDAASVVADQPRSVDVRMDFQFQFPKTGVTVKVAGRTFSQTEAAAGLTIASEETFISVSLSHRLCETRNLKVKARPAVTIPVRLKFKPATLRVDAGEDTGALIEVYDSSGSFVGRGRAGQSISIPIVDAENPKRTLRLNVIPSLAGSRTIKNYPATVTAGTPTTVNVKLR